MEYQDGHGKGIEILIEKGVKVNSLKKIVEKMVKDMETIEERKKVEHLKLLKNKLRGKKLMNLLIMYGGFDGSYWSLKDIYEESGQTKENVQKNLEWLSKEYPEIKEIIEKNRKRVKRVYDRQTHNLFLHQELEYDDKTMGEYVEEQF